MAQLTGVCGKGGGGVTVCHEVRFHPPPPRAPPPLPHHTHAYTHTHAVNHGSEKVVLELADSGTNHYVQTCVISK